MTSLKEIAREILRIETQPGGDKTPRWKELISLFVSGTKVPAERRKSTRIPCSIYMGMFNIVNLSHMGALLEMTHQHRTILGGGLRWESPKLKVIFSINRIEHHGDMKRVAVTYFEISDRNYFFEKYYYPAYVLYLRSYAFMEEKA